MFIVIIDKNIIGSIVVDIKSFVNYYISIDFLHVSCSGNEHTGLLARWLV